MPASAEITTGRPVPPAASSPSSWSRSERRPVEPTAPAGPARQQPGELAPAGARRGGPGGARRRLPRYRLARPALVSRAGGNGAAQPAQFRRRVDPQLAGQQFSGPVEQFERSGLLTG